MNPDDTDLPAPSALLPPEQSLASLVREVHRNFARIIGHRMAEYGVTASMWSYLWVLWQKDGINQHEIAKRVNLEGPTVGSALRVMEKRGLIRRKRNAADRRELLIYLTARGKALRPKLLAIGGALNDEAVATLGKAKTIRLVNALVQVRETMEAMRLQLPDADDD